MDTVMNTVLSKISDVSEVEYRISDRVSDRVSDRSDGGGSGISYATYNKLLICQFDSDNKSPSMCSDIITFHTSDIERCVFIDNNERMVVYNENKTQKYRYVGHLSAGLSYKLIVSDEIRPDAPPVMTKVDHEATADHEAIAANIRSCIESIYDAKKRPLNCVLFGYGKTEYTALKQAKGVSNITIIDITPPLDTSSAPDTYMSIYDLVNDDAKSDANSCLVIIDCCFIQLYANQDHKMLQKTYEWIQSKMNISSVFVSITPKYNIDTYSLVATHYADKKLYYSSIHMTDRQLSYFMYLYHLIPHGSPTIVINDTFNMNMYIKRSGAQFSKHMTPAESGVYVRKKSTTTVIKNNFVIDLSIIKYEGHFADLWKPAMNTTIKYEAEFEFIGKPTPATVYQPIQWIERFLTAGYGGGRLYSMVLSVIKKEVKPICLYRDNMPSLDIMNGMAVTIKTNGVRYYLIDYNGHIYLANSGDEIHIGTGNATKNGVRTIMDGELINDDYVIFDCIVFNYENITRRTLPQRQSCVRSYVDAGQRDGANVKYNVKYKKYESSGDFYKRVINTLVDASNTQSSIENDGLIFTPINHPYSYSHPIYKFKYDKMQMTIDFYISGNRCNVYDADRTKFVPFYNTKSSSKIVCQYISEQVPYFISDKHGNMNVSEKICECSYDEQNKVFDVVRIRDDKTFPNHISVANATLKSIIDYISLPEFCAQMCPDNDGTAVLRYYHNCIKRRIIHKYMGDDNNKCYDLLDIGSGVGGDVSKYARLCPSLQNVYLTEPDSGKIDELKCRAAHSLSCINHQVIQTKAQNIDLGCSVDCVCSFFMLTFMYENEATLDAFVDVIDKHLKTDGYFIGTMLDDHDHFTTIKSKHINIERRGQRIHTQIGSRINQMEYSSSFDKLVNKLKMRGIQLIESERFESEPFLTKVENIMSDMYRYFAFQKHTYNVMYLPRFQMQSLNDIINVMSADSLDLILKYGSCVGINRFVCERLKKCRTSAQPVRYHQLKELPFININHIESNLLTLYNDLIRIDYTFRVRCWCILNHKNAIIMTRGRWATAPLNPNGTTATAPPQYITICKVWPYTLWLNQCIIN